MRKLLLIIVIHFSFICLAQGIENMKAVVSRKTATLSGYVTDKGNNQPLEFVMVYLPECKLWSVTDKKGHFDIYDVPTGKVKINIYIIGYKRVETVVDNNIEGNSYRIALEEDNLELDEVIVTAKTDNDGHTSTYSIDRSALDHAQIKNIGSVVSLLPGGKTSSGNLATSDDRVALRAAAGEMGNASFGTAIALDGIRLDNNSNMNETKGVGLRNIATSNIESVEIITGMPSVEYGDLSNGIVKIVTKKGRTPFMAEFSTEPRTRLMAINKGLSLGSHGGTLNGSFERAISISNLASPYTAYDRNTMSLVYANTLNRKGRHPIYLNAGIRGNTGGYDSKADPDAFINNYTKENDYALHGHITADLQLNRRWITSLLVSTSISLADKRSEQNTSRSSSSTQPFIHSLEEGYFIATNYDEDATAPIISGPTGYWDELRYSDSKPITYTFKMKAELASKISHGSNKLMAGIDYSTSGNKGRGVYYDDMRLAPTWRQYRYDALPFIHNTALYAEDGVSLNTNAHGGSLRLTAGVRYDISSIKQSEYGTTGSLSPRGNIRYTLWNDKSSTIESINLYGSFGKAVKLPSFEVLYPSTTYSDKLAFAPGTLSDGTTFYAYYTTPSKAIYNPKLKWQYTNQTELGAEATIRGTHINISVFRNVTHDPYMATAVYTPYTYKQTTQTHLENCIIPSTDRRYSIDRATGIVTVEDKTGNNPTQQLSYNERNTFRSNTLYTNGSPVKRMGLEWIIDFAKIKAINTTMRLDGKYYYYKGLDDTMVAYLPSSANNMYDGNPYKYIGYYKGSNSSSTSYTSSASVSNGSLSKEITTNITITAHIPRIRMILSLRVENSLYNYKQNLCEHADGSYRGIVLANGGDYTGEYGKVYDTDKYVAVYPEYYSTWESPGERIPFYEKYLWAKDNDKTLYNELSKLVVKTNTSYYFNSNRISSYFSANFNLTKEIGDYASVSFYANNFINHFGTVKSSQTNTETSLYNSSYIPKYYYGLTLKLKI